MAFPTVETADTKNGTVTSNSNSWTLTYPTNLVSGDLIVACLGTDGSSGGATWPANFGFGQNNQGATTAHVGFKVSDGTETGTFSVTIGASEQGGWRVFRVTGWYGGTVTGLDNSGGGSSDDVAGIAKRQGNAGTDANPNPISNNPTNWDVEDTLWLAMAAVDTSRTFSGFPASYTTTASDVSGGSTGASLGTAWRNNAVASEDPGTFTISASDDWACITVAIRPAAPAIPASDVPRPRGQRRAWQALIGR